MSIIKLDHLGKTIIFGQGSTSEVFNKISEMKPYKIGLLIDRRVAKAYPNVLEEMWLRFGLDMIYYIDSGDVSKTLDTVVDIWEGLVKNRFTRKSLLISLGGGVVNDIAGFVASTFMRGLSLIVIPTTLLSQADASIGGKNGVNFYGKNMIGTFYIPDLVVIDPVYIKSLGTQEVTNGIVEIIKHGILGSENLLKFLAENREDIINREIDVVEKAILQSIKIKLNIISRDFRETGHRMILNLGHTIGHAIEELTHHRISHGEAVAYGIRIAMRLGEKLFGFRDTDKIEEMLFDYGLPQDFPFKLDGLLDMMKQDKKNWYGKLVFAVPKEIGDIEIISLEEEEARILLGDILEDMSVNNV